jgi:hypothetical protein
MKAVHMLREECNKYDLTAGPCFWLANHNDCSRWFAISSSHVFAVPPFSFMGGVAKTWITELGCENIFAGCHIPSTGGDALSKYRV